MKKILLSLLCLFAICTLVHAAQFTAFNIGATSTTTASFNFTINPQGEDVTMTLEYNTNSAALGSGPSMSLGVAPAVYGTTSYGSQTLTGLLPNTTYYARLKGVGATYQQANYSTVISFTTFSVTAPTIASIVALPYSYTATINYTINANYGATTSIVKYGLSASALTSQVTGGNASGTGNMASTANITGLTANTTYYYQILATNSAGTTSSVVNSFVTNAPPTQPTISGVNAVATAFVSTIAYTINANNDASTTVIKYGLSATALTSQVAGSAIAGNVTTSFTTPITNLLPATTYYYQIDVANSIGTSQSLVNSFTTTTFTANSTDLVAYYSFDNTFNSYNNTHNLASYTATSPTFAAGKYGQAASFNGAQTLVNSSLDAVLNNFEFTIAFWEYRLAPTTTYSTSYEFFASHYFRALNGTSKAGLAITPNLYTGEASYGNIETGVWHHYAIVFKPVTNSSSLIIYRDGVLVNSIGAAYGSSLFHFNNKFTVGGGTDGGGTINATKYFTGSIDEMYIYNRALSNAEIVNLKDNYRGLPLTLASFTGKLNNNTTQLNWATSQEINTSHFNIEYSNNGKDFISVQSISAAGNSSNIKNYAASHKVNNESNHYYRLKIIDKDGSFTYSQIIKLKTASKALQVDVYPSVVTNNATMSIATTEKTTGLISITNMDGQVIKKYNINIETGSQTEKIDVSNLSKGVYLVTLQTNNQQQTFKIIKQ